MQASFFNEIKWNPCVGNHNPIVQRHTSGRDQHEIIRSHLLTSQREKGVGRFISPLLSLYIRTPRKKKPGCKHIAGISALAADWGPYLSFPRVHTVCGPASLPKVLVYAWRPRLVDAMAPNMKFWDDWADPEDMEALWERPDVSKEWIKAGELRGQKVHMSRNLDGRPYVTHTEMRAMAEITIQRHFRRLDQAMICAIAEIESARQPLAYRYEPKLGEASTGLMQTLQSTAEWLQKDMGYRAYTIETVSATLYRPFVSVYFGAAYLKWLSTYDGKRRSEEFMVRGYNGGPKGATEKSTLPYWNKYLLAKQNLPNQSEVPLILVTPIITKPSSPSPHTSAGVAAHGVTASGSSRASRKEWTYWNDKASLEDMEAMWRDPDVKREWTKSHEIRDQVRFARDTELRPYLTTTELKAVAENIVARFFAERGVSSIMLCRIAEVSSKRLLYGADGVSGIMQTSYPTAAWLYNDMGYKSYRLKSVEDLSKPFFAMYFGGSLCLLAFKLWWQEVDSFGGSRPRTDEFVVRAYRGGPKGVDDPTAGLFWHKYMDAKPYRNELKSQSGSCRIM